MTVAAGGRATRRAPARDVARLLALGRAELDALFAGSEAGPVPDGEYRGTLIAPLSPAFLRGAGAWAGGLAWRGKVFDAAAGRVVNRVLPFGLRAVAAEVRRGPSRLDGRECIVLDYSRDRKSTRLNSSHANISYAVFCLKKKNTNSHSHSLSSLTRL